MLAPLLVSNAVALILILVALKRPRIARAVVGVGFIAAACFNVVTIVIQPQAYVRGFGPLAVGFLILSPFRRALHVGLAGGIIFLVAIAPLGLGSAFPSTLLLAVALGLLVRPEPGDRT